MLYERTNKRRNTTEIHENPKRRLGACLPSGEPASAQLTAEILLSLKKSSRKNEARSGKAHTNVNQILSGVSVVATKYQVRLWRIELEMDSSTY